MGGWNLEKRELNSQNNEFDSQKEINSCIGDIKKMPLQDVQSVIENLAANDNEFNSKLCEFQDENSQKLQSQLSLLSDDNNENTENWPVIVEVWDLISQKQKELLEQRAQIFIDYFALKTFIDLWTVSAGQDANSLWFKWARNDDDIMKDTTWKIWNLMNNLQNQIMEPSFSRKLFLEKVENIKKEMERSESQENVLDTDFIFEDSIDTMFSTVLDKNKTLEEKQYQIYSEFRENTNYYKNSISHLWKNILGKKDFSEINLIINSQSLSDIFLNWWTKQDIEKILPDYIDKKEVASDLYDHFEKLNKSLEKKRNEYEEIFKKQDPSASRENIKKAVDNLIKISSFEAIKWNLTEILLHKYIEDKPKLRDNKLVDLYWDMVWSWAFDFSDENLNFAFEVAVNVALCLIPLWAWVLAARLAVWWVRTIVASRLASAWISVWTKLSTVWNFANNSIVWWISFYEAYNLANTAIFEENFDNLLDSSTDIKEIWKSIAFFGALHVLWPIFRTKYWLDSIKGLQSGVPKEILKNTWAILIEAWIISSIWMWVELIFEWDASMTFQEYVEMVALVSIFRGSWKIEEIINKNWWARNVILNLSSGASLVFSNISNNLRWNTEIKKWSNSQNPILHDLSSLYSFESFRHNISKADIENIPWFSRIFDSSRWDIIRDSITREELASFVNSNKPLKDMMEFYKKKHWKIIDPDSFRTLFTDYKWFNSSQFDSIVWKLSKIYFKLELSTIDSLRLLWWAPWSWKSISLEHFKNSKTNWLTFDSTLNNIKFVDYLIKEAKEAWVSRIEIDFVYRSPELAWESVVDRAIKNWRPVNLSYFKSTYENIFKVINELNKRGNINLRVIDNSWIINDIKVLNINEINGLVFKRISNSELVDITNRIIDKKIESIIIDSKIDLKQKSKKIDFLKKLKKELLK